MKFTYAVVVCVVLAGGGAASASGPRVGDLHGDDVVVTTADGTVYTEAMIDSILVGYPKSVRNAFKKIGLVWHGDRRYLTFEELAAYCAPVLWFSPDEPLLNGAAGKDIRQPTFFPFEPGADQPVVYYRIRGVQMDTDYAQETPILSDADPERRSTRIDLAQVRGIDLDYFFFYPSEEGLGAHKYDVEAVEMKLVVVWPRRHPDLGYWVTVQKITAKAHGILWYDNNLEVDRHTRFPCHLLVEEGKHASCTDKNADGHYTPAYDVNLRVNDAWGVRDVMASGSLYSGGFQAWMAKPRHPEHRVLPPLPEDSPLRSWLSVDGVYAMLGRQDYQNIYLMFSDHLHFWHAAKLVLEPKFPWEFVQMGNCGSPIETEAGWLVLSHGVGTMRKYCIGAFLLDRDDPTRVVGRLREPLITPGENEREGYVPNVVYSCGSLLHGRLLVIPYGMSDYATTFATVSLDDLLAAMA